MNVWIIQHDLGLIVRQPRHAVDDGLEKVGMNYLALCCNFPYHAKCKP